jgi:hypothetical protein
MSGMSLLLGVDAGAGHVPQSTYSISLASASSQYVSLPGAPSGGGGSPFTISAWIKQTSTTSGYRSLYCQDGNHGLFIQATKVNFFESADHAGATSLTTGTWHHIAVTYDGTTLTIYVDGVSDGSYVNAAFSLFTAGYIGSDGGGDPYFDGNIDDVAVWTSCLTGTQIANLAAGTLDPATISPASLWRFEEGSGTTANDSGSGGHTGTLTNGVTWSTDVPTQLQ